MAADIPSTGASAGAGSRTWRAVVHCLGVPRPRRGRRAVLLSWWSLSSIEPLRAKESAAFVLIAVGAALAQLFPVVTPRDQSYHTTMVVLVPAALLLPAWLLPAVVVVQHVPEWLKVRYPWYIQAFNASNYLVDLFAAAAVGRYRARRRRRDHERRAPLRRRRPRRRGRARRAQPPHPRRRCCGSGAGTRSASRACSSFENLSTEFVLAALGVLVAYAWPINPALIPFAVAPLLLIHRSLAVPRLEQEARLDPKTGLYNVRHFSAVLNERLEQAARTGAAARAVDDRPRPAARDQQHPRPPRRRCGPGADRRGLPRQASGPTTSRPDSAARSSSCSLPETDAKDALALAERVREAVGASGSRRGDRARRLSATVSIGVAMCPRDGTDASHADPSRRPRRVPREDPGPQPRRRRRAASRSPTCMPNSRAVGDRRSPRERARRRHGCRHPPASPRVAGSRRRLRPSPDESDWSSGRSGHRACRRRSPGSLLTALGVAGDATCSGPPTSSRCWRSPRSSPAVRRSRSRPRRARSRSARSARSRARR